MHVRSLFSEKVIDVIKANTVDLGPLSFDSFRKNNLSASWKFSVQEDLIPHEIVETDKKRTPRGQEGGQSQTVDTTAKLVRRVKVQEAGTDWGWGVVVIVVKKPAPPLGSLPPGLSSSRDSSYIVDTLLHYSIVCADSSLSNLLIIHSFPNSNALPLVNN